MVLKDEIKVNFAKGESSYEVPKIHQCTETSNCLRLADIIELREGFVKDHLL